MEHEREIGDATFMNLSYLCKMGNDWRKKLALRRKDATYLLLKRAANLQLQGQIRKANYLTELQHEEKRIKNYQSQMGASFPTHMRDRQVQIEEQIRNIK